jgi:creatinine amidohydrolase
MFITEMTMLDFSEHLKQTQTLLLPFGTLEEHGNHLPLNTDALIVEETLKEVAKKRRVFLAPTLYYGVCTSTSPFPGTIGITPRALRIFTRDLITAYYEKGFRRFFLISGHAGGIHMSALREVCETMIHELDDVKIAVFTLYDFMWKEMAELAETKNDSHAGEIETSLIMALAPHLVKGTSPEEYPNFPKPYIVKDKRKYWSGGVWGNPAKATAEKGRIALKLMVNKICELLDNVDGV